MGKTAFVSSAYIELSTVCYARPAIKVMYAEVQTNADRPQIVGARTISLALTTAALFISVRTFIKEDEHMGMRRLLQTLSPVLILATLCKILQPRGTLSECPRYVACITFANVVSLAWPTLLAKHNLLETKEEETMAWLTTMSIIATTIIHSYQW